MLHYTSEKIKTVFILLLNRILQFIRCCCRICIAVLCAILFYDYCYVHCWLGACAKENIDSYHINASIFPLSPPRTSRLLIQFYPISSTPGNIFIIIEYAASVVQYQLIFNNIASKFEPFTIVFFILSQHFLRHCLYQLSTTFHVN